MHVRVLDRERFGLLRRVSPTMYQASFLFSVDMVTNLTDYAFHLYLGAWLLPADFAAVQTMNAVILVTGTAFAVLQPVVARFAARAAAVAEVEESAGRKLIDGQKAIFQVYFRQSLVLGLGVTLLLLLGRKSIAGWLNVPVDAVTVVSLMGFLSVVRPVVSGMLQGMQRFVSFGLTRATYAIGRFAVMLLLVGALGGGAAAGLGSIPVGGLLALLLGLALLGRGLWQQVPPAPRSVVWQGWRLSAGALFAYTAFIGLQNNDLIWVNRLFAAEDAGSYAAAVVLRRVLAALPGAVLVILYPRVVSRVTRGLYPDRLLAKTAVVVLGADLMVTLIYFLSGPLLIQVMFGARYEPAGALLGWMGLAMTGYGLAAIWINLFLATRPWPYLAMLVSALVIQTALLAALPAAGGLPAVNGQPAGLGTLPGLGTVTAIFAASGWGPAIGGLLLYVLWLRPKLPYSSNLT